MYLPRSRARSAQHPTNRVTYEHQADGQSGWSTPTSYSTQGYDGVMDTISDCPHKGFARSRNRGEIVMGDLTLTKWQRDHADGEFTFGPWGNPLPGLGWGVRRVYGDFAAWVEGRVTDHASIASDVAQSKQIALSKAYAKMNESAVMTGELLSDLGRTVSMLRRPFKSSISLCNKMLNLRKVRLGKTTASAARASTNAWLEYRMGFKPLISDMDNVLEECATKYALGLGGRRLVARASVPFSRLLTNTQRLAGGLPQLDAVDVVGTYRHSGSASAGVIYEVKTRTTTEQFLASGGLRLRDVPATIWEIIPFSFVVDWFSNVGHVLQAALPDPDVTVLGSWITTKDDAQTDLILYGEVSLGPSGPYAKQTWKNLDCGSSSVKTVSVTREVNPILDLTPTWRATSLSLSQLTDAAALMTQLTNITELLWRIKR